MAKLGAHTGTDSNIHSVFWAGNVPSQGLRFPPYLGLEDTQEGLEP